MLCANVLRILASAVVFSVSEQRRADTLTEQNGSHIMTYFADSEKIDGTITALDLPGVTIDPWGGVVLADDVTAEDLATLARHLYRIGTRAQRIVNDLYSTLEYERNTSKRVAEIFGEMAKAAAIDQRWCQEYEGWTEKIGQALTAAGFYSQSQAFKEKSDRREKYTLTLTVLAANANNAYDLRFAIEEALSERGAGRNYGVTVDEFSEVTRVIPEVEEDPNGEDVTY